MIIVTRGFNYSSFKVNTKISIEDILAILFFYTKFCKNIEQLAKIKAKYVGIGMVITIKCLLYKFSITHHYPNQFLLLSSILYQKLPLIEAL